MTTTFIRVHFKVRDCLQQLNDDLESAFIKVKENEIRLNELILKMYGMQNDFSSEVSDEILV